MKHTNPKPLADPVLRTLVGITHSASIHSATGALRMIPTRHQAFAFAKRHNLAAVLKYCPTKKGWVVFDTREMRTRDVNLTSARNVVIYTGYVQLDKVFASQDAALVVAIHALRA